MIIGVPTETKSDEYRVALLPVGAKELSRAGHRVLVQRGAGQGSGIADDDFLGAGAEIVENARDVFDAAELVVKVKEPQPAEWPMLRPSQVVLTYFHFAASVELTRNALDSQITAVAYETIGDGAGRLPLLTPMSEVAGRMSIQEGAKYLEKPFLGRGILLAGVPGVKPASVTVLGGGIVGTNAAKLAAGMGANVTVLDVNVDRLRYLEDIMPPNVTTLYSDAYTIADSLREADLVIGSVLIPGGRTPRLITREHLTRMRPGAVLVDVAVDQGGCAETSRPTTHAEPTYLEEEVVHYGVTNMPGAVGRTSTYALCNVTLPYVRSIAGSGLWGACEKVPMLRRGINVHQGRVTNRAVAETFDLPFHNLP